MECVPPYVHTEVIRSQIACTVRRIDFAFDTGSFTVGQVLDVLMSGEGYTSPAARASIIHVNSPFQLREDGKTGCETVYLGSKTSERRLRVYNLHGPTRIELQVRGDWAVAWGCKILLTPYEEWASTAAGMLATYIDIETDWWRDFFKSAVMSDIRVYSARHVDVDRLKRWISKQVAPALFALQAAEGLEEWQAFIVSNVTEKRLERYEHIMAWGGSGGEAAARAGYKLHTQYAA
jgi:DNA relaxase NicK